MKFTMLNRLPANVSGERRTIIPFTGVWQTGTGKLGLRAYPPSQPFWILLNPEENCSVEDDVY